MAHILIKRVGGKTKIRKWIKERLPPHNIYIEPFGGSFAVGFIMPPSDGSTYRKVYNDLDGHVSNLFKVLRDNCEEFLRLVELTPYSRKDFAASVAFIEGGDWKTAEPIEWARNYLIYNRQSIFGKETGNWCISLHGENICMTWNNLPNLISALSSSLKEAYIECLDYKDVLNKWDSYEALFYMDPPYEGVEQNFYHVNKKDGFNHEELRDRLLTINGSWAISYYDSKYIRDLYAGYEFHELEVKKHMQTSSSKKTVTELLIVHANKWATSDSFTDLFES